MVVESEEKCLRVEYVGGATSLRLCRLPERGPVRRLALAVRHQDEALGLTLDGPTAQALADWLVQMFPPALEIPLAPVTESSLPQSMQTRLAERRLWQAKAERVMEIVARYFGMRWTERTWRGRAAGRAWPRMLTFYFIHRWTGLGWSAIGRLAGRNHATIFLAAEVVEKELAAEATRRLEGVEYDVQKVIADLEVQMAAALGEPAGPAEGGE